STILIFTPGSVSLASCWMSGRRAGLRAVGPKSGIAFTENSRRAPSGDSLSSLSQPARSLPATTVGQAGAGAGGVAAGGVTTGGGTAGGLGVVAGGLAGGGCVTGIGTVAGGVAGAPAGGWAFK